MKTKYRIPVVLIPAVLLLLPIASFGSTILATRDIFTAGGSAQITSTVEINVRVIDQARTQFLDVFFEDVGESDVGTTFILDSGSIFDDAVSIITNGVNDSIYTEFAGSGIQRTEALFFFDDSSGASGIDLAGATIERFELVINQLSVESPGTDNNGDGIWTTYSGNATFNVVGTLGAQVPVPAALWMFGSALGLLAILREKVN